MCNVLWLEEEKGSLIFERRLMEDKGWIMTQASTAMEARQLVNGHKYDLIVADLIVPTDQFEEQRRYVDTEAGIRFIEWIRDVGRLPVITPPDVLVVVISANAGPETRARLIDKYIPNDFFLSKPVDQNDYTDLLEKLSVLIH